MSAIWSLRSMGGGADSAAAPLASDNSNVATGIEIQNLGVRFGGVRALHDINLRLGPGEIRGLLGPNGSGKSTLFNAVTGMVPVSSGTVMLDGCDLSRVAPAARTRLGIARTFQTPRIDPNLTVQDAVLCGFFPSVKHGVLRSLLGLDILSGGERRLRVQCRELLEQLTLGEVMQARLETLSLGQLRLVDVARAMAAGSRYLLLDEPAAGLTVPEQKHLAVTIHRLTAQGVGVLLVEHNFAMLSELCDEVLVLNRGEMLLRGRLESIRHRAEFVQAYLGSSGGSPLRVCHAKPADAVPALRCAELTAHYGQIKALSGVALAVHRGECLAVLGPNGAGKTTLLNALCGLARNSGEITVGRASVSALTPHGRVAAGLGLVPEMRGNIFAPMSVQENLQIATQVHPPKDRAAVLAYLFDLFPILGERIETAAGMLSGGEQQMLAIAMAVGRKPTVLLLDEPSQGLAPAIYDVLEKALERLCGEGMAVIIAEQNLAFAARVADRFVVLLDGQVCGGGAVQELAHPEQIIQRYFPDEAADAPAVAAQVA